MRSRSTSERWSGQATVRPASTPTEWEVRLAAMSYVKIRRRSPQGAVRGTQQQPGNLDVHRSSSFALVPMALQYNSRVAARQRREAARPP